MNGNISVASLDGADSISTSAHILATTTEYLDELEDIALSNVLQLRGCENADSCLPNKVFDALLTVWYFVQCLALLALNLYILWKLWLQRNTRHRFIKERINTLILALTLTDLIMVVPMILTIASLWYGRSDFRRRYYPSSIHPPQPPPPNLLQLGCDISSVLFGFSSQLSILIVMLISSLRLTSVLFPLKAHIILSSRVVACSLLSSAVFVFVLALLPYTHKTRASYTMDLGICATVSLKDRTLPETEIFMTSTVPFLLPLLISLCCLVGLTVRMIQCNRTSKSIKNKKSKQVTQTVTTAVQLTGVFILCYIPFIFDGFIFLLNQYNINTFYSVMICKNCSTIMYIRHVFKVLLIYLNGAINPFLYGKSIAIGPPPLINSKRSYKLISVHNINNNNNKNINNNNPGILNVNQDEDGEAE